MIVVDASAIVDGLIRVDGTDELVRRLSEEDLQAPMLLDYEVESALRGLTLGRLLSPTRASEAVADFGDLPIHRWEPSVGLCQRSFALRHSLPSYDAAYVVLAEALGCPLVTRDALVARTSGHEAVIELG